LEEYNVWRSNILECSTTVQLAPRVVWYDWVWQGHSPKATSKLMLLVLWDNEYGQALAWYPEADAWHPTDSQNIIDLSLQAAEGNFDLVCTHTPSFGQTKRHYLRFDSTDEKQMFLNLVASYGSSSGGMLWYKPYDVGGGIDMSWDKPYDGLGYGAGFASEQQQLRAIGGNPREGRSSVDHPSDSHRTSVSQADVSMLISDSSADVSHASQKHFEIQSLMPKVSGLDFLEAGPGEDLHKHPIEEATTSEVGEPLNTSPPRSDRSLDDWSSTIDKTQPSFAIRRPSAESASLKMNKDDLATPIRQLLPKTPPKASYIHSLLSTDQAADSSTSLGTPISLKTPPSRTWSAARSERGTMMRGSTIPTSKDISRIIAQVMDRSLENASPSSSPQASASELSRPRPSRILSDSNHPTHTASPSPPPSNFLSKLFFQASTENSLTSFPATQVATANSKIALDKLKHALNRHGLAEVAEGSKRSQRTLHQTLSTSHRRISDEYGDVDVEGSNISPLPMPGMSGEEDGSVPFRISSLISLPEAAILQPPENASIPAQQQIGVESTAGMFGEGEGSMPYRILSRISLPEAAILQPPENASIPAQQQKGEESTADDFDVQEDALATGRASDSEITDLQSRQTSPPLLADPRFGQDRDPMGKVGEGRDLNDTWGVSGEQAGEHGSEKDGEPPLVVHQV
jgi:hypothetical protein